MATILVVDDDFATNVLIAKAMKQAGHEPRTVFSGEEAVARCADGGFALVILDLTLPKLNGFGVMRKMREMGLLDTVPVLVITARTDREARITAEDLGATDFLQKPFEIDELALRVKRCLEKGPKSRWAKRGAGATAGAGERSSPAAPAPEAAPLFPEPPSFRRFAGPDSEPPSFRRGPDGEPASFRRVHGPPSPMPDAWRPPGEAPEPPSRRLAGPRDPTLGVSPGKLRLARPADADKADCVGVLDRLRPGELLRMCQVLKKTGFVDLRNGDVEGEIVVEEGEIISCRIFRRGESIADGDMALKALLAWETGKFRMILRAVKLPPENVYP